MEIFYDAHSHISAFATTLSLCNLSSCKSFNDIKTKLKEFISVNNISKNDFVIGFGYDHNSLLQKAHPDKNVLDDISNHYCILITHISGHVGCVNSKALHYLKINKNTPNPQGGLIQKDKNGEPTGYLEETAFINYSKSVPKMSIQSLANYMLKAQEIYKKQGIAIAQDGFIGKDEMALYNYMVKNNMLTIDVIGYVEISLKDELKEDILRYKDFVNHFKIGGYKTFLDGSPQAKTAYMLSPYINNGEQNNDYKGYPVLTDETLYSYIQSSMKDKMQLLAHCNGDGACEQFISQWEKYCKDNNITDITYENSKTNRPTIIHAQFITENQLIRAKKLGIIPSFFVSHVKYWGDIHIENVGFERAKSISPIKTAIKLGIPFTLHNDTPVLPMDIDDIISIACNRKTLSGITLGQEQKVSETEAKKGLQENVLYQYFL